MGFEETRAYEIWEFLQKQEVPRAAGDIADALRLSALTTVGELERLFACGKVKRVEIVGASGNTGDTVFTRVYWSSEKTAFLLRDRWEDDENWTEIDEV